MNLSDKPLLIFIVGSTATGKTEFSLAAHKQIESSLHVPCEIVNFDSVQVFKGVEIGTAKPTREQRAAAPHHLVDFVAKGQGYTAGEYRRDALRVLSERSKAGVKVFLLVGGSGFYAQALEKGMFELAPVDPKIRIQLDDQMKALGLPELYRELSEKDPDYASTIASQDTYRVLRGLEIIQSQGKTLTQIKTEFAQKPSELRGNYSIIKIGLRADREELKERIKARTTRMLTNGWIDEVRSLREEGLSQWSPLQSVGYKEIQQFLDGILTESELREKIILSTMQLAKRQATWFKRDTEVQWCASEPEFKGSNDQIAKIISQQLGSTR